MTFDELDTPALLLDHAKMDRNIARMTARLAQAGVAFRPHLKTCKSIDVARRHFPADADGKRIGPVTVSTLKEADYFFSYGFTDILYAVGIAQHKLKHVADLRARGCDLKIILDNQVSADAVAAFANAHAKPVPALIEIDSDDHRAGVKPGADELISIGRTLATANCLAGVMTHAGESYNCRSIEAIRAMAEQERARTVRAATRLREAGLPSASAPRRPPPTPSISTASPKCAPACSCSSISSWPVSTSAKSMTSPSRCSPP